MGLTAHYYEVILLHNKGRKALDNGGLLPQGKGRKAPKMNAFGLDFY